MPEEIPFRRICNLSPRIVSPEFGHALQVCCVNTLGMSPQHVSIDVSHWEIQNMSIERIFPAISITFQFSCRPYGSSKHSPRRYCSHRTLGKISSSKMRLQSPS